MNKEWIFIPTNSSQENNNIKKMNNKDLLDNLINKIKKENITYKKIDKIDNDIEKGVYENIEKGVYKNIEKGVYKNIEKENYNLDIIKPYIYNKYLRISIAFSFIYSSIYIYKFIYKY